MPAPSGGYVRPTSVKAPDGKYYTVNPDGSQGAEVTGSGWGVGDVAGMGRDVLASNPVTGQAIAGIDLVTGNPGDAVGDLAGSLTGGIVGGPHSDVITEGGIADVVTPANAVVEGVKDGVNAIVPGLGLSGPDTGALDGDIANARAQRDAFLNDFNGMGPRDVPQVTAPTLGAAPTVQNQQIAPTERVQAPTLGPAAQVTAAQQGPAAQVTAAQQGPVERAAAERAQAATIDTAGQAQIRAQQLGLINSLQGAAAGTSGPSAAEGQFRRQSDEAMQSQIAMAQSARGGPGQRLAALRAAMANVGKGQAQAATDAAILRAKEQQGARGELGQALTGARGQDIGVATDQAQLVQGANLANAGAGTQVSVANAGAANQAAATNTGNVQQANVVNAGAANTVAANNTANQQQTNVVNAGATNAQTATQGQIDLAAGTTNANATNARNTNQAQLDLDAGKTNAGLTQTRDITQANLTQGANQGNQTATLQGRGQDDTAKASARGDAIQVQGQVLNADNEKLAAVEAGKDRRTKLIGNTVNAVAGGVAALSDERAKTDIHPGSAEVRAFLDSIAPKEFKYKQPAAAGAAPGDHIGVIAQEVERTKAGRGMVEDTPGGKMIDTRQAVGALLASMADMHQRMKTVEGRRRSA